MPPEPQNLSVSDRVGIVLSTLRPFPKAARGVERQTFANVVDEIGAGSVYRYLADRRLVNAALVVHGGHAEVAAESGDFWLSGVVGLACQAIQRRELARTAAAFAERGLRLLAFKGVAFDAALSNSAAPSFSSDVDLLVPRESLAAARALLGELGYECDLKIDHGRPRRMPSRISQLTEQSVYSFGQVRPYGRLVPADDLEQLRDRVVALFPRHFCVQSGQLRYRMSVDLHYTLNLVSDDIGTRVKPAPEVWWESTQAIEIDGVRVETLHDRVMSWALPHRLYVDSMLLGDASLKALCHLKLLWLAGRLDVAHTEETARRYPYLAPSLHHALRAFGRICDVPIRTDTTPQRVRTTKAPLMNAGDCLPALLDVGFDVDLADHPRAAEPFTFRLF